MPLYQITAIVRASSSIGDVKGLLTKVNKIVLGSSGVVANVSNWGVQPLAYRMKAHQEYHREGRYLQLKYVVSPTALKEVERTLKLDERVLRFLTIKECNTSIMTMGGYDADKLAVAVQELVKSRVQDGAAGDAFNFPTDPQLAAEPAK
mmetsp:Transcript_51427/g.134300  ORF Transcript_51427/g.134300 Transcript_51427/m.134300 type:complete len:149 (+) Transcript_51427:195-641(+)